MGDAVGPTIGAPNGITKSDLGSPISDLKEVIVPPFTYHSEELILGSVPFRPLRYG